MNPLSTLSQVAQRYCVSCDDLRGKTRNAEIVVARHMACYQLWREYQQMTLREIGELLGGRTPATVYYGIHKVIARLSCRGD